MVPVVIAMMKDFYPNLAEKQSIVQKMILNEEENFLKTLENGERKLYELLEKSPTKKLSGSDAFLLYDTFGFPLELTMEIAQERSYTVDTEGFEQALQEQKLRARASRQQEQSMNIQNEAYLKFASFCRFVGYEQLSAQGLVTGVFVNGERVKTGSGEVVITTDVTPFYAESGGQIGDTGIVSVDGREHQVLILSNFPKDNMPMLWIWVSIRFRRHERSVDRRPRPDGHHAQPYGYPPFEPIASNHLGSHVVQQGSQVSDKTLRSISTIIKTLP